jgi:DNA repair protein RadC
MERPRGENPARLLVRHGAENLSDAQLLTILLGREKGCAARDASLGGQLASRFGHPARLGRASLVELCSVEGISRHRASRIKAALELGRRSLLPLRESPRLTNSREAADFFLPRLGHREVEVFCCALLDTRNRLLRDVVVATGTVNACFIHPREVYRAAIAESACAVILAHNHPSGELSPSDEDLSLTRRIMEAGAVIGIRVLDHLIVGPGGYFSFLDAGLLASPKLP